MAVEERRGQGRQTSRSTHRSNGSPAEQGQADRRQITACMDALTVPTAQDPCASWSRTQVAYPDLPDSVRQRRATSPDHRHGLVDETPETG